MLRSATHPFVVATLLGGIVGATVAMIGGVRLRSEHLGPSGDPAAQKVWALDLFGLPTLTGLHSQAGAFAWALLAFTVVGIIVAVLLTMLVRRRLYGVR